MNERALRVVLLAQRENLEETVKRQLDGAGVTSTIQRVTDDVAFKEALVAHSTDVVIADRPNRDQSRWSDYVAARKIRPSAPFILLTDRLDEETFINYARHNPDDLVLMENLGRLAPAILEALETRRPLSKLSPRQIEVLRMVAEGRSTREIADTLNLSAKTVESHRSAMMKRLALHGIASLVRYAVRMGLVRVDEGDPRLE
jgi:DNA-binding NarL/FixJ family response regulator